MALGLGDIGDGESVFQGIVARSDWRWGISCPCILIDYIRLVLLSWKMSFPVFNTKTVPLIRGSEEKASSFYCTLVKDTAYTHTDLRRGDGGVVCEGRGWVSQGVL